MSSREELEHSLRSAAVGYSARMENPNFVLPIGNDEFIAFGTKRGISALVNSVDDTPLKSRVPVSYRKNVNCCGNCVHVFAGSFSTAMGNLYCRKDSNCSIDFPFGNEVQLKEEFAKAWKEQHLVEETGVCDLWEPRNSYDEKREEQHDR